MRAKIFIALCAVLFVAGTVFAGDNGNGCKLQGTWISDGPFPAGDGSGDYTLKQFTTFYGNGTGDNDGTLQLDYANPWPGEGLLWTINRGVWKKSGGNSYKTRVYCSLADEMGNIYGIVRYDGTVTIQDCNTLHIANVGVLVDPETLEPIMPFGSGGFTARRMTLPEP